MQVAAGGRVPRARYRASLVAHQSTCILFGGHDGSKHLKDTHIFDIGTVLNFKTKPCFY